MRKFTKKSAVVLAILSALVAGCTSGRAGGYALDPPEQLGDGLEVGTFEEVGIDPAPLGEAVEAIRSREYGEVHSLLIFRDGKLVFEEYFPGHDYQWDGPNFHGEWVDWDEARAHNIHSVGKSITSACVGIAVEQGFIESVDQSIFDYLPAHQHLKTGGKDRITIEHLLTMSSGLAWDEWDTAYSSQENDVIRLWTACDDQVACVLEAPLVSEPGMAFTYSGGAMVILGEIVRNATGMDIEAFSAKHLFEPLGIDAPAWPRFDSGVIYAGGDQRLTPRDMLKFGLLYLDEGVWDGQQLVSEDWVERSAEPYVGPGNRWFNSPLRSIPPGNSATGPRGYSYTWWTHEFVGRGDRVAAYWALGFGGQDIVVLPDLDAVVVFTGGNYTSAPAGSRILTKYVLPAFR